MYIRFLDNNSSLSDRYVFDSSLAFGISWVFVAIAKFFPFKKSFVIISYLKFIFVCVAYENGGIALCRLTGTCADDNKSLRSVDSQ